MADRGAGGTWVTLALREWLHASAAPNMKLRVGRSFGIEFTGVARRGPGQARVSVSGVDLSTVLEDCGPALRAAGLSPPPGLVALAEQLPSAVGNEADQLAAAAEFEAVARRKLRAGDTAGTVLVDSVSTDVLACHGSEEPRSVSRRHGRVSIAVPVGAAAPQVDARASVAGVGRLADLSVADVAAAADKALAQAARLEGARLLSDFSGPAVLSPEAAALLVHETIGHALEADNYVRAVSADGSVNVRIASSLVNVRDLGSEPGHWGSLVIDDEGVETRPTELVSEGFTSGLLTNSDWADRLGASNSGHARRVRDTDEPLPRLARLELLPSANDPDALVEAAGGGLYVESIASGGLDPASGLVTLRLRESRHLGGTRRTTYVGGVVRAPFRDLLGSIEAIGSDTRWSAAWCLKQRQIAPVAHAAPTVFVNVLTVG